MEASIQPIGLWTLRYWKPRGERFARVLERGAQEIDALEVGEFYRNRVRLGAGGWVRCGLWSDDIEPLAPRDAVDVEVRTIERDDFRNAGRFGKINQGNIGEVRKPVAILFQQGDDPHRTRQDVNNRKHVSGDHA